MPGVSRKASVAGAFTPLDAILMTCRPTLESPRFVVPRNIVNAARLSAAVGRKLMFTVTSTLSVVERAVAVADRPTCTY